MTEIRKPAIKIHQGERILFVTTFSVKDFSAGNFYRVDRLDVQESTGMQRLLSQTRVNSYSKDILAASRAGEVFLPTSVFLATESPIGYDEKKQELFFDSSSDGGVCPFDVVDGQHRIEGFKKAVDGNKELMNFPIPVVIAPNLSEAERMLQFVVVNTKQTPVVKDVAQHIIARFTKMLEVEDVPHLPDWLRKATEKGDDDKALTIAKALNKDNDSPWHGRIQFADEVRDKKQHTIKQGAFVVSIKRYLFTRSHPFLLISSNETRRLAILKNFWKAVNNIFVDPSSSVQSVVFKSNGMEFFHSIFATVLNQLAKGRDYRVEIFEQCIRSAEEYLSNTAKIMHPVYWQTGNEAGGLNSGAIAKLTKEFTDALLSVSESENNDIQT